MAEALVLVWAFVGVIVGVLGRLLLPWYRKLRSGEIEGFDKKFLITALISLGISVPIAAILFPAFLTGFDAEVGALIAFITGATFGWGAEDAINEIVAT